MTKVPGDQIVKDFELVAKEMNCSQGLLHKLEQISDFGKEFDQKDTLVWNKDCRFCGRTYFDGTVWFGLYFDIGGSYTLLLGFYTEKNNTKFEQRLKNGHRQYFYKWYGINEKEEENWLYVSLDKYLLFYCSNLDDSKNEIKELIKKIKC